MKELVLDMLPTETVHVDPTTTIQRLTQLEKHTSFCYAPRSVQKKVRMIQVYVARLAENKATAVFDDGSMSDNLIGAAIRQFQYYVRDPPAGETPAAEQEVKFGTSALCEMWHKLNTLNYPDSITLKHLQIFDTYAWLLPADTYKDIKDMVKHQVQISEAALHILHKQTAKATGKTGARGARRSSGAHSDNVKAAMAEFGL